MPPDEPRDYGDEELAVIEHVGSLVEYWGFKKQMGRAWCVLFYSPQPLPSEEIARRLSISAGLANMTLNGLLEWGVIRKIWVQGERKTHYEAETRPWPMISRVLERREVQEIDRVIASLSEVLGRMRALDLPAGTARDLREFRISRVEALLELAGRGRRILEGALKVSRIKIALLQGFSLDLAAALLKRALPSSATVPAGEPEVPAQDDLCGPLSEDDLAVVESVARMIDLWGFGRSMGRVWCVLYLAMRTLPADAIQSALSISAGLVNTTLNSLIEWGVVRKIWVPGQRKAYFAAETEPWPMISRVLREREYHRVLEAIAVCEAALSAPAERGKSPALRRDRTKSLLALFRLGKKLLDSVLDVPEVNLKTLQEFQLKGE
ncbi:MAG: hypothetical protein HY720_30315 [Planctomycetes bacterium]|nr:hypothetical protein [Planctomycetota bacterium]